MVWIKWKRAAKLQVCNPLILWVEHIGVEPMTSWLPEKIPGNFTFQFLMLQFPLIVVSRTAKLSGREGWRSLWPLYPSVWHAILSAVSAYIDRILVFIHQRSDRGYEFCHVQFRYSNLKIWSRPDHAKPGQPCPPFYGTPLWGSLEFQCFADPDFPWVHQQGAIQDLK